MIIKIYQTGFGSRITDAPVRRGTLGDWVAQPSCLAMSDRCMSFPVNDERAWAYHVSLQPEIHITIKTDVHTGNISGKITNIPVWAIRRTSGQTPYGLPSVQGNYVWTASKGGTEIFHYYGPPSAGYGSETWYVENKGVTLDYSFGPLAPGAESQKFDLADILNNVNGLRAHAAMSIVNDTRVDYKPGAMFHNGIWRSHDRISGECAIIKDNGKCQDMTTIIGSTKCGNPPSIYKGGKWVNQDRFGSQSV